MTSIPKYAYYNEGKFTALTKLAFNVQDAKQLLRNLKPLQQKIPGEVIGAVPSKSWLQKNVIDKLPFFDPSFALKDAPPLLDKPYISLPKYRGDLAHWFQKGMPGIEADPYYVRATKNLSLKIKTPEERIMFEALMKGHEKAELIGHKNPSEFFKEKFEHISPEVIFNEHNMLMAMPEHIRKKLLPLMDFLRNPGRGSSEAMDLGIATKGRFMYGESPRINRHERKHLTDLVEKHFEQRKVKKKKKHKFIF